MNDKNNEFFEYKVFCGDLITDIIPNSALSHLSFSQESIKDWNKDSDLRKFLCELYNFDSDTILHTGEKATINMSWFGYEVFERKRYDFIEMGKEFSESVNIALKTATQKNCKKHIQHYSGIHNFFEDNLFGQTGKYFIAWEQLVTRTLEDSLFFSIAHVLESLDDLKCSFHLAANFYYKQAIQMLRNFIEDLVLPIQFCDSPQEYISWKANNYRVPPLRGKNGLLKKFKENQILSSQLADKVSDLYGKLNGFVHGSEERLINKGHYSSNWEGHVFKEKDYKEWCNLVCRTIEIGIYLLKRNLDQWQQLKSQGSIVCLICHSQNQFDTDKEIFGNEEFIQYTCQICGHRMSLDKNLEKVVTVTVFDEESLHK